jgi:aspartate-semialdehyde dehydrogenase
MVEGFVGKAGGNNTVRKGRSMSNKIAVGILGATGMVGQEYIRLLQDHPWFEVTWLAASERSAGRPYREVVRGRWHGACAIPDDVADMIVGNATDVDQACKQCELVFSAVDMDKTAIAALEEEYAGAGIAVVSNNSAHRRTDDVPMIIPEINSNHLSLIDLQRGNRGWNRGCIVVKSNCSIQSYMTPLYALITGGYQVEKMFVATLQALSGAGYPGPSAYDMVDNVIPLIPGEEEKTEHEPLKILGNIGVNGIENASYPRITAHCNRVPVIHGHTACVSIGFSNGNIPEADEVIEVWRGFRGEPQRCNLPSAPVIPVHVRMEKDRPQPRLDRDAEGGMVVSVGRIRTCPLLDIRFVGLHHNTVRGAAGGCVLTAELLKVKGYMG